MTWSGESSTWGWGSSSRPLLTAPASNWGFNPDRHCRVQRLAPSSRGRTPHGTRPDSGGFGWRSTGMVSREDREVAHGVVSALPIEERAMAHRAPAWMENLVEVISECVEAQSPMGPLGYRYLAQGDPCELM